MKLKLRFTEGVLGTAPANGEIYEDFIRSKHPNGGGADEIDSLPDADEVDVEEDLKKSITVFHRDEDGAPVLYDYQIKGFFKDAILALQNMDGSLLATQEKQKKLKLTLYMYKRTIDNLLFITPRRVRLNLPQGASLTHCQRPLRAATMRGERVALACSEEAPAGTELACTITVLNKALVPVVRECLEYGALKGIGQWRNSGKGRFEFEIEE